MMSAFLEWVIENDLIVQSVMAVVIALAINSLARRDDDS